MSQQLHENILHRTLNLLTTGELAQLRSALSVSLRPAQIVRLIESSTPEEQKLIWHVLSPQRRPEVLQLLDNTVASHFLEDAQDEDLAAYLSKLQDDDIADIVANLPSQLLDHILFELEDEQRERVRTLLNYPPHSAGGLLSTDILTLPESATIGLALRFIRRKRSLPKDTDMIYLTHESTQKLLGKLPITALLLEPPEKLLGECMQKAEPFFSLMASAQEVMTTFENDNLVSAPVVDDEGRPIGRIMIDDVVDAIRKDAESSVLSLGYLSQSDSLFGPISRSAMLRALWLGLNLLTTFATVILVYVFSNTLQKDVRLAAWLPTVASMGGIATTQTFTLFVRSAAQDSLVFRRWGLVLKREVLVGLCNGLLWGVCLMLFVGFANHAALLGLLVGLSLFINIAWASACGALLPIILRRFGIDSALSGGVILTTFTDSMGYFSLLGLATLVLTYQDSLNHFIRFLHLS